MDTKYLEEKGLLEEAKRFNYIMEYIGGANPVEEADANMDGLDDTTGMADPMGGGAQAGAMGATAPVPAAGSNAMAPAPTPGADPAAIQGGAPGFNPQQVDTDAPGAQESFDEATPDVASEQQPESNEDEEVIDVDELVDSQKRNEEAIDNLTNKFESFLGKFEEFQNKLESNAELMTKLEDEFVKRNPTAVEKMTMRSLESKPFSETPEEYMKYDAPENYSPEDDKNGVGEPRYTITRDDVRNATDYPSIAQTLQDNENATLRNLLGL